MSVLRAFRGSAIAVLVWMAMACQRHAEVAPAAGAVGAWVDTVALTESSPRALVPLALEAVPASASIAEVQIVRVENPAKTAFSLQVRIAWGTEAQAGLPGAGVVLGTVATYPSNAPSGRFMLGVDEELRQVRTALREAGNAPVFLVLELLPVAADRPLRTSLRVHVAPVRWRERVPGGDQRRR